jgi:hypothetical protein
MVRKESSEMRQGMLERLHAMAESMEAKEEDEKDRGSVEGEQGIVEEGDLLARAVEACFMKRDAVGQCNLAQ